MLENGFDDPELSTGIIYRFLSRCRKQAANQWQAADHGVNGYHARETKYPKFSAK